MNANDKHADWLLKPTANELADIQAFKTEELTIWERNTTATMLRQQQAEIEAMNLSNEEIGLLTTDPRFSHIESPLLLEFARAVLRKANEK